VTTETPPCPHMFTELHKLSDMCSELVCLNCGEVVGFRIDGAVFGREESGPGPTVTKPPTHISTQRRVEGKPTKLSWSERLKLV